MPIAGLHHAARDGAAGFCIFNDMRRADREAAAGGGLARVAYVDIDAHHGDGVFYAFEADPMLVFADLHEDGAVPLSRHRAAPMKRGSGAAARHAS